MEPSGVVYLPKKDTYNVYTDVAVVAKSVKEPKFRLVENPEEADILWIAEHFKDFKYVITIDVYTCSWKVIKVCFFFINFKYVTDIA